MCRGGCDDTGLFKFKMRWFKTSHTLLRRVAIFYKYKEKMSCTLVWLNSLDSFKGENNYKAKKTEEDFFL